jgi:predicted dehydrogenase
MTVKPRIAVIGTGWWATDYHLPGLQANSECIISAICDADPGRLQKAATAYQVSRAYTSYQEMLANEDLDAAVIATPHATHYEIAIACLKRGLHLLIEKPMTLYAQHARHLVRLAEVQGKALMVCYPHNYTPQVQRARQVIRSGELGEVHYVINSFTSNMTHFLGGNVSPDNPPIRYFKIQGPSEAYNQPELMGGGQGHLQLTHGLGMLFYATGLRAGSVNARMSNHGRPLDMVNAITVEFENGALGIIGSSGKARVGTGVVLNIYCEEGCFVYDSLVKAAVLQRINGAPEDLASLAFWGPRYSVVDNFVGVILGRQANESPGENGLRVVEVLDAAYRSAQQGGTAVRIDDLYQETDAKEV